MNCSNVFVLGFLPFNMVMLQNSQSKGQPREYCKESDAYFFISSNPHIGFGDNVMSGYSSEV